VNDFGASRDVDHRVLMRLPSDEGPEPPAPIGFPLHEDPKREARDFAGRIHRPLKNPRVGFKSLGYGVPEKQDALSLRAESRLKEGHPPLLQFLLELEDVPLHGRHLESLVLKPALGFKLVFAKEGQCRWISQELITQLLS